MYHLDISEETRRFIGGQLTNCNPGDTAMTIAALSRATGISRVTLTKWTQSGLRLYWLTKHIGDEELAKPHGRRYYSGDPRVFDHAQEYCDRVRQIRADALAGLFGEIWQDEERERKRAEATTPRRV